MFLKTFASNIIANYEIGKQPTAVSGHWKIFDGKKKSTTATVSIFVFERKSLEPNSSGLVSRTSSTSIKKAQDEVVERLKKEASSLARLRHPSILQLVEPVEDTRNGGLMLATEPVTASLAGLLSEKDDQERSGGVGGKPSRYVVEDPDGTRRRRDVDMDELEIQKGLLQVAKGLEFLHESAGLVHGNLTPEAVYVNAKSDWKISGLSFAGPPDGAEGHQTYPPISLSEVLYHDPRLPRSVQLNLDYTSPDFVLDSNVTTSADIFSLGLVILALYNFPHASPIQTNGNQSTYKKIMGSSSTAPSSANDFLSTRPLPGELSQTLSRLLTRRPAQRMTAKEFQQSSYFDNILVNTIRFLDALPAKTTNEKSQFMRGLGRVMPQFPASVLGKKVLSALLDEMKDHELLALILQNVFQIIKTIPSGRRVFPESVLPRLREVFLTKSKSGEREAWKEAGLMVVLENIKMISENCSGKEFKDDVLPIMQLGLESSTHPLIDASLQSIPVILLVLDFTTVKHDVFPVVSTVFTRTSSLGIKVRGLEVLAVLCGAPVSSKSNSIDDDFSGTIKAKKSSKDSSGTILDRFTVQEKVIPLLKGIKTKEPAVMMSALNVFRQVGKIADTEFLAVDVLPILWTFSLGPLLDLQQFKAFMDLIKSLSLKIEREQTRKLQELSSDSRTTGTRSPDRPDGVTSSDRSIGDTVGSEGDFARLVLGDRAKDNDIFGTIALPQKSDAQMPAKVTPSFSWSSASKPVSQRIGDLSSMNVLQPQQSPSRSITPDMGMNSFPALQPTNNPVGSGFPNPVPDSALSAWSNSPSSIPPTQNQRTLSNPSLPTTGSYRGSGQTLHQPLQHSSYLSNSLLPPPPINNLLQGQGSSPLNPSMSTSMIPPPNKPMATSWQQPQYRPGLADRNGSTYPNSYLAMPQNQGQQKQGLDKYQSLL